MNSSINILMVLISSIAMIACGGSSTKRLGKGSFDEAIRKAVKALQKDPSDVGELEVLQKAYSQSKAKRLATINRLLLQRNGESLANVRSAEC